MAYTDDHCLFLSSRWIDQGMMSASSVQGQLSANNVQTLRPDQVWRSTGCAAEWLAWDFGEDVHADTLVAIAHNLSLTAQWRFRLGSTPTLSGGPDTGLISAWPSSGKPDDRDWQSWFSMARVANTAGFRYGRMDVVDPDNTAGYVQFGRVMCGPAFVPEHNLDINPALGLVSPGEVIISPFGRTFTEDRGPAARAMAVAFSALDEDEYTDELFELQRYCGVARDFAFCRSPLYTTKFHKFAMQARFDPLQPAQAQQFWNANGRQVWQTALTLAEVL